MTAQKSSTVTWSPVRFFLEKRPTAVAMSRSKPSRPRASGAFGCQVQGQLPAHVVAVDVVAQGVEALLQREGNELGRHEVVLVDHVHRSTIVQGPARPQQFAQESAAPAGASAGDHLLELHLRRGLLDPRITSQRVHDHGGSGGVDGHRAHDHVAAAAMELITVIARLVDGDPSAGAGTVVGRCLAVVAAEVRSEQPVPAFGA
ncbi:hypothetical protein G3I32_19620 [Streptomyces coelicoflavus]|uniref:Uncharacterized protein n=1 Tax=Streptomyces coelicoflavus TaxID=285562 RepID=A0A7K3PM43_9ACTN|nr:hypothetical protein [Streptomyces coelicoflavus]NEB10298.1 hypothetical protein [Streptomyces coelicoflavus]NEB11022.1 hypothetical protein [Streptomyces coelicoflavus]